MIATGIAKIDRGFRTEHDASVLNQMFLPAMGPEAPLEGGSMEPGDLETVKELCHIGLLKGPERPAGAPAYSLGF
jgi:hypothetical protein